MSAALSLHNYRIPAPPDRLCANEARAWVDVTGLFSPRAFEPEHGVALECTAIALARYRATGDYDWLDAYESGIAALSGMMGTDDE